MENFIQSHTFCFIQSCISPGWTKPALPIPRKLNSLSSGSIFDSLCVSWVDGLGKSQTALQLNCVYCFYREERRKDLLLFPLTLSAVVCFYSDKNWNRFLQKKKRQICIFSFYYYFYYCISISTDNNQYIRTYMRYKDKKKNINTKHLNHKYQHTFIFIRGERCFLTKKWVQNPPHLISGDFITIQIKH